MSDYNDYEKLLYPTPECTNECKGMCGYCPEHEKAQLGRSGDFIIGSDHYNWQHFHKKDQPTLYLSTSRSQYPNICGYEKYICYGRGCMKTSVPYGHKFTHESAGMLLPAIAGKGKVFGINYDTAWVLTVGGKCWRY
jgi:hypothetical protein